MQHVSHTEEQTIKIAEQIGKNLVNGGLLLLNGELGTGKTLFTQALLKSLGLGEKAGKSPTYTYIRHYKHAAQNIYHLDLYRLAGPDQLLENEIQELLLDPHNITIIEWADKILHLKSQKHISIEFEYLDPSTRKLTINENL